jgi:hypothetical protein
MPLSPLLLPASVACAPFFCHNTPVVVVVIVCIGILATIFVVWSSALLIILSFAFFQVAQWVGSHLARNFHAMFPNGGREDVALGIDDDGCSGSATKRAARTTPGAVSAPTPAARTPRGGGSGAVTCSQELVLQALAAIAAAHRTTTAEVQRLKPGGERRRFHDDITATVLLLSPAREVFDPQVFRTP